jgi:hypothetical protein
MWRTRTCATSLIPSCRHGSSRVDCPGFDVRCWRDGFVFFFTPTGECATFLTFGAAGLTDTGRCFCTVAAAGLAARSPEPPAQPAARIGTRTQLAARAVANG